MDFYIMSMPRSGSHMLASALDGHSCISCQGEHQYPWLGIQKGKIVHGALTGPKHRVSVQHKIICLTRDSRDCVCSLQRRASGQLHFLEPTEIKEVGIVDEADVQYFDSMKEYMLDLFKAHERLVLDYSEITDNKDCREIPESIGKRICDFLGVVYEPLKPKFYKPRIAA